jgi:alpha-galactosidase
VKSPLIMGNDIRVLTNKSLSILINPAVLAISQDPNGSSAVRRWRYYLPSLVNSTYPPDEIHLWSGTLANGDYIVILLNAGASPRVMNATLADVFIDQGGSMSKEAQSSWDMHDLWANRMSDSLAQSIINANGTSNVSAADLSAVYWNKTATSFADGIARNASTLMGKMVGTVQANGKIESYVASHGLKAYRLRPHS